MALGVKQWLGLVGFGVALVALGTLPPAEVNVPTRRPPLPEQQRLDVLRRKVVATNNTLQRVRWAEEVVPGTLAGEGPVVFGFPDGAVPEQVERVRTRTAAEVDEVAAGASDVALGVFFVDYRDARYPGAPTGAQLDVHYFFGEKDGRPYCAVVRPVWRRAAPDQIHLPGVPSDGSYLGVCGLVRAYGLPGPAVRAWLAGGGAVLATSGRPTQGTVLLYGTLGDVALARREVFGTPNLAFGYLPTRMDYDRCFAGVTMGCAEMFVHPALVNAFDGPGSVSGRTARSHWPASAVQGRSIFEPADYHVAADLAEEFGRERFRRWWVAEGDVAEAFEASFGVDVGTWNLRRIGGFVTISRPGPSVSQAGFVGGVLLLALSSIIAGLWARRRRVA